MEDIKDLKKELDNYEKRLFYLKMKDHWSREDFRLSAKLDRKITELEDKIKEKSKE